MKSILFIFWLGVFFLTACTESVSPRETFPLVKSDNASPGNGARQSASNPGPTDPPLSISPSKLLGLNATKGKTAVGTLVNIIGVGLPSNAQLTATAQAPAGFEICEQQNGHYSDVLTLTLPTNSGGRVWQLLYVRLKTATTGSFSGNVTLTIPGLQLSAQMAISGTVHPQTSVTHAYTPATLPVLSTSQGTPSTPRAYILSGQNFVFSNTVVHVFAPTGFELSKQPGGAYSPKLSYDLAPVNGNYSITVYVRLKGETAGSMSGIITHSFMGGLTVLEYPVTGVIYPASVHAARQ